MTLERVAQVFGLGRPLAPPSRVAGGLSNELWRLDTGLGTYAVKRMIANAGNPGFTANVEAAFQVELRAWNAGVPAPEPIPLDGRALAHVDGSLFRVHRWADGQPGAGTRTQALGLLATIHAAGAPRWASPPQPPWLAGRWGDDIARLARRVAATPDRVQVVDSHRDLDPKNTLLRDGRLIALDWDAAGPICAVHERVAAILDWSGLDWSGLDWSGPDWSGPDLDRDLGRDLAAEPDWAYGGWVAAQGGWLDYQAGLPTGAEQVDVTLRRLRRLAALLDRPGAGAPHHP